MPTITGQPNRAYVSAIALLDKREINPSSLDIHNEEGLTDIMGIAGRYKPTQMAIYHNYTNDPLFKTGVANAAPTGSGTKASPLVIVLTTGTSGFARKGDLVKFPDGKVGAVKAVTPGANDTITVEPVNASATLVCANGATISFFSNFVGEKSLAPTNRRYGLTKYFNLIQSFREVNEETDVQTMSAIEVQFKGQNRYHVKNLADKYILHKAAVNAALIGGSMSLAADGTTPAEFSTTLSTDALIDQVGSGSAQTTRGLDETIGLRGVDDTVDAPGAIDMDDFEQHINLLVARKAPKSYMAWYGTAVGMKVANTLKGLGSSDITKGKLSLDGKEANFEVETLVYGGFKIQFSNLPILDNQDLFGNCDIYKRIYFIPTDKVKVRGGGSEPRCQIRYMKHNISPKSNDGNDIWAEWSTGALAPSGATSDEAIWRTNWQTFQGFEGLGVEHMSRVKVLA